MHSSARAYGTALRLPRRSVAVLLGTSVTLTGALAGVLVPGPARALFPRRPPPAASSQAPPPAFAPVPPTPPWVLVPSTLLQLEELHMLSATEGWALTIDRDLVRVTEGGRKLRVVGPANVVESTFFGAGAGGAGAVVTTTGPRGGSLGVYRTLDGGQTFTSSQIDAGVGPIRSEGLAFLGPERGVVVVHEESSACCGAWATTDGGRTFARIVSDPTWHAVAVGGEVWIGLDDASVVAWSGGASVAPPRGLDGCEVELAELGPRASNAMIRATCDTGSRWFARRGDSWSELGADEASTSWGFLDPRHGYRWRSERGTQRNVFELTSDGARSWTQVPGAPSDPIDTLLLDSTTALIVARSGDAEDGTFDRGWVARDGAFTASSIVTIVGEKLMLSAPTPQVVFAAVRGNGGSRLYVSRDAARTFKQVFAE